MTPPKMRAIQAEDSIIERNKRRRRKPAKLHSMDAAFDGKKKREEPVFGMREDGQFMFYAGKENAIYGETEAGKDMLLVETVSQALDFGHSVCWIDFEEGDEIDIASRLREMGASRDAVCDQWLFRFSTPDDVDAAQDSVWDAVEHRCDLVIFNGLQSAYGLFGWELFDPNSPVMFRRALVAPLLKRHRCVITTDHVTKVSADGKHNGSRYAAGGIAKLNWVTGAAYMLESVDTIIRGAVGRSNIILTKDRPGFVKSRCMRIDKVPTMMYAGTLIVKSTGDEVSGYSLRVDVKAPQPGSVVRDKAKAKLNGTEYEDVPDDVLEKVLGLYQKLGNQGASKRSIVKMYRGDGSRHVLAAINILKTHGCLVFAAPSKTSNMAMLRYAKDWSRD